MPQGLNSTLPDLSSWLRPARAAGSCTRFAAPTGFPCGFTGTLPPDVPVLLHKLASRADLRVHYPRLYPFCCTGRLPMRIYGYITTGCTRFSAQTGFPCGFTGTLPPDVPVLLHRPASRADLRVHYHRMYPFCCTDRLAVLIYGYITPGCTRFSAQTGFPCGFTGTFQTILPECL